MKKTLTAAGVKADDARVKATATALKDVEIDKVLAETTIAAAPATSGAAPASEAPAKELTADSSKLKAKEEEGASEEEAAAGLGALFG